MAKSKDGRRRGKGSSAKKQNAVERGYHIDSALIHGREMSPKWDFSHHVVPPISSSVTYRLASVMRGGEGFCEFGSGHFEDRSPIYIYDRLDEPTRGMLEENLAIAEGSEIAVCFATGMAAIAAATNMLLGANDELVAHHVLYGCTYSLFTNWLPRYGIKVKLVDFNNRKKLERAITAKTRCVYFETPVNPHLELIDIAEIASIVRKKNKGRPKNKRARVVVDNTFATPYCQRPLSLGADIVVHSLTKGIGGFGTDMGGVVVTSTEFETDLMLYRKDFGGALAPKTAWPILVYGLPTLALRQKRQMESAKRIAAFLEDHPRVASVVYPGSKSCPDYHVARKQMRDAEGSFAPGNMIYFELKKGRGKAGASAERMINHIAKHAYSITLAVSLGQIKTLIESPGCMTHSALPPEEMEKANVNLYGIRLSVGLESVDDLIGDLKKALAKA